MCAVNIWKAACKAVGAAGVLGRASIRVAFRPTGTSLRSGLLPQRTKLEILALVALTFGELGVMVSEGIAKPGPPSTEFIEVQCSVCLQT